MNNPNKVFGHGSANPEALLTEKEISDILSDSFAACDLQGKKLLIVIPDGTRTMPLALFFRLITEKLSGITAKIDFIIALGTHQPMSEEAICKHLGITVEDHQKKYSNIEFINHDWSNPDVFMKLGDFPAERIDQLSMGTINQSIPVEINKVILNYDVLMVCGPVFPHEVMGFSGGSKYFFPGISAPAFINATHWIGAMNTCYKTIGVRDTPTRALIEEAASWLPVPYFFCCPVVKKEGVYGLFCGQAYETWKQAADLSAQVHVRYEKKKFKKVLSVMPDLYDDIWTAAKGMYKLEPVVEDGGELIIYAPHITEISYTHRKYIDDIGYHCRDYFVKQWDKFKNEPWGVLAHSTHLTGLGTFENGVEHKRIKVTLATGISQERCERVNLGYLDPGTINPESFAGKEAQGILYVPYAGETLYRMEYENETKF